ncbi:MFS transporter [Amycolatopsis orientalis]|uniref:MFS transporter n=1 Tax=Amycolatopsis orientalis TaxID=31958 RepID=UPI00039C6303|nr:MFS transporter [Amycolatopsis orientalis]
MTTVRPHHRIIGGSIGTFVEWYDFLIYSLSAPVLARHFFPASNEVASLLGTFGIYAIAFFMRPLGGLFFGRLGDRHGRVPILSVTVLSMGAATMVMGLLPTYGSVGLWATALLLLCRLVQGFAVGGETSGGMSYVLESAPPDRRGRWVGVVGATAFLPAAVAALFVLALRNAFGDQGYLTWAWRIPFLAGALLAVVGLWLRRRLDDPEEFLEASREAQHDSPDRPSRKLRLKSITTVVLLISVMAVSGYLLSSYFYTFLVGTARLGATAALLSNAAAIVVVFVLLPVGGALSDRIGRKPLLIGGTLWLLAGAYPAMKLASSGTVAGAFAGQVVLAIGIASVHAGGFVAMLELFPTATRYSGHALAYNLGFAVFGGTTPLIASALVSGTGSTLAPAFYLMAAAVLGLLVALRTPETRGVSLRSAADRDRDREAPAERLSSGN